MKKIYIISRVKLYTHIRNWGFLKYFTSKTFLKNLKNYLNNNNNNFHVDHYLKNTTIIYKIFRIITLSNILFIYIYSTFIYY